MITETKLTRLRPKLSKIKIISGLLAVGLVLAGASQYTLFAQAENVGGGCVAVDPEMACIPDEALRRVINQELGKGDVATDIRLSEMSSLTYLGSHYNDGDPQITDLTGLETAVNLDHLTLSRYQISDLTPLAELNNLTYINLDSNQISDLTPLAELINLTYLSFQNNQISDLTPLAELTDLIFLAVSGNKITDVSPIANLPSVTFMAYTNHIADWSVFKDHPNLANFAPLNTYLQLITLKPDATGTFTPQWIDQNGVVHKYTLPTDSAFDTTRFFNENMQALMDGADLSTLDNFTEQAIANPVLRSNGDGTYTFLRQPENPSQFGFVIDAMSDQAVTGLDAQSLAGELFNPLMPSFFRFDLSNIDFDAINIHVTDITDTDLTPELKQQNITNVYNIRAIDFKDDPIDITTPTQIRIPRTAALGAFNTYKLAILNNHGQITGYLNTTYDQDFIYFTTSSIGRYGLMASLTEKVPATGVGRAINQILPLISSLVLLAGTGLLALLKLKG